MVRSQGVTAGTHTTSPLRASSPTLSGEAYPDLACARNGANAGKRRQLLGISGCTVPVPGADIRTCVTVAGPISLKRCTWVRECHRSTGTVLRDQPRRGRRAPGRQLYTSPGRDQECIFCQLLAGPPVTSRTCPSRGRPTRPRTPGPIAAAWASWNGIATYAAGAMWMTRRCRPPQFPGRAGTQ